MNADSWLIQAEGRISKATAAALAGQDIDSATDAALEVAKAWAGCLALDAETIAERAQRRALTNSELIAIDQWLAWAVTVALAAGSGAPAQEVTAARNIAARCRDLVRPILDGEEVTHAA